ncbi:MAG: hypothetical protein AAGH74_03680 [Pseudomonadota bacterium]
MPLKAPTLLALSLLLLVAPDFSRAHLNHPDGLVVLVYTADAKDVAPGEEREVALHIINGYPVAVTLRGLWLNGHGALTIEKLRDFFLFKTWQKVKFLRLEPGEERAILPPGYRIKMPGDLWRSELHPVLADFGPLGTIEAYKLFRNTGLDDAVGQ